MKKLASLKKMASIACGVALSAGAAVANATTYNLTGFSQTNLVINGADLGHGDITGTGSTSGGFASFTYTSHLTSAADANVNALLASTLVFPDTSGAFTETYVSCVDSGTTLACPNIAPLIGVPQAMDLTVLDDGTFDFSNPASSLTWGYSVTAPIVALGGLPGKTVYSYTAVAAVPVPAAAWLFGSALLGLASVGRRRNTA